MPKGKPKKKRFCKRCGDEFQPTNGLQKFCGPKCWLDRVPKEPMFGRCRTCGAHYEKSREDQKYCTARCRGRAKGRRITTSTRFPAGWSLAVKGEEGCRNCGRRADHLHHIVPRGKAPKGKAEVARNGMPLCFDCHRGWHDRRVTIYRDRLSADELAFAEREGGVVWVEKNYPYRPDEELRRLYCMSRGEDPDENQWKYCLEGQQGREVFDASEAHIRAFGGFSVVGLVGMHEAYRRVTA